MIHKEVKKSIGFLRTTALGGLFFLLPLAVIGALVGQLIQIVWVAAEAISSTGIITAHTPWGYAVLFMSGLGVIVLLCFVAGIVARRALGQRFKETAEKYLLMLFPRYAIFKEQLSDNIGGNQFRNMMKPVAIKYLGIRRVAMEVERTDDGEVVVFLPGSPDPWVGTVILVPQVDVTRLDEGFGEAMATFEQLGRSTGELISKTMD